MAKMDEARILTLNRCLARAIRDARQFKCGELTVDLQVAHYTSGTGGYSTGLHQHECFELAHVVEGTMGYSIGNDGAVVHAMNARKPGWILIPPALVHVRRVLSPTSTVLGIMLRMAAVSDATMPRFNQTLRTCGYLQRSPESRRRLKLLDGEFGRGPTLLPERLGNILELIVLDVFQVFCPKLFSGRQGASERQRLPEMISAYLDEHLNSDLSLPSLARMYHLSPRHLNRIFTGHCGISPGQYLIRRRLKLCAHQLLNTDKQVKQIAADCGFRHQGYFIRQFSRHYGSRPSEYRRRG